MIVLLHVEPKKSTFSKTDGGVRSATELGLHFNSRLNHSKARVKNLSLQPFGVLVVLAIDTSSHANQLVLVICSEESADYVLLGEGLRRLSSNWISWNNQPLESGSAMKHEDLMY